MAGPSFTVITGDPERGAAQFAALLHAAGDGTHSLALSAVIDNHPFHVSTLVLAEGPVREIDEKAAPNFRALLAALGTGNHNGFVTLRTRTTDPSTDRLSGWNSVNGALISLTADELAEIFDRPSFEPGVEFAVAPDLDPTAGFTDEDTQPGTDLFKRISDVAGDGRHKLTVRLNIHGMAGTQTMGMIVNGTTVDTDPATSPAMMRLLSATASGHASAGIVLRTVTTPPRSTLRGWTVSRDRYRSLTAAELYEFFGASPSATGLPTDPHAEFAPAPSIQPRPYPHN